MTAIREKIVFYLNHERVEISGEDAFLTLSTWLRVKRAMTGTKIVCSEGDCGACTIILGWMNPVGKLEYRIVDSCIQFLFQLDSCHVITVEALAENGKLHPAQQAMVECFGSQCGFCTPGFVMALADMAEKKQSHTTVTIKDKLAGNLCRCTGYEAIVKAGLALNSVQQVKISERFDRKFMEGEFAKTSGQSLKVETANGQTFFKPVNLTEALKLRAAMPQLRIVAGATDLGVQHNKRRSIISQAMFIAHLHEIAAIQKNGDVLEIGAAANWSDVLAVTKTELPELHAILKIFAAEQIRNAATIGGNVINASPIADSLPCLYALGARLVVTSATGAREIDINSFYTGYKKFDLKPDELLTKVILPLPKTGSLFKLYKVSNRRDLDISTVTLAIHLQMAGSKITGAQLAAGGVAATILRLKNTEKLLIGAELSEDLLRKAGDTAMSEIQPQSDVRGSADFRKILIRNLFRKFYSETTTAASAKAG
jgi:xanthine dehydrogenase small subunit